MYKVIKRLFLAGQLTEKGLLEAVARGWISQEQADALLELEDGETE